MRILKQLLEEIGKVLIGGKNDEELTRSWESGSAIQVFGPHEKPTTWLDLPPKGSKNSKRPVWKNGAKYRISPKQGY